jgi:hypothetical protein
MIHPKARHGINFSYNVTGAYAVMLDFMGKHGLYEIELQWLTC